MTPMAETGIAQVREILERAERILLVTKEQWTIDDVAAATALKAFLEKSGKAVEIAVSGFEASRVPAFVSSQSVQKELHGLRDFLIAVSLERASLKDLSYEIHGDKLMLRLAPETGMWQKEDVSIGKGAYRYNLIISIGAPDLASLGAIKETNPEFFAEVPIINIDHDRDNEFFGVLNAIDITASAASEVVFVLMEELDRTKIDAHMATSLLGGIMAKTKSYRTGRIAAKTLDVSAALIEYGASQDAIVEALFQKRSVGLLKLWGKALARIQSDTECRLAWTSLTQNDFLETGMPDVEPRELIDEFMSATPDAETVFLLYEEDGREKKTVKGLLATKTGNARSLIAHLRPVGTKQVVSFTAPEDDITRAEETLARDLRMRLGTGSRLRSR